MPDEYQDSLSVGSLFKARSCWQQLLAADRLALPQQFSFAFRCPSALMATALYESLRRAADAGCVGSVDRDAAQVEGSWQVTGRTHDTPWSLPSLEHLFMRLRRAGSRFDSSLTTLDLVAAP